MQAQWPVGRGSWTSANAEQGGWSCAAIQ